MIERAEVMCLMKVSLWTGVTDEFLVCWNLLYRKSKTTLLTNSFEVATYAANVAKKVLESLMYSSLNRYSSINS